MQSALRRALEFTACGYSSTAGLRPGDDGRVHAPGKTAQCPGCKMTQEIPGDAPPPQFNAGKVTGAPSGRGGGGGGGMIKLIVIVVALAVVAWFLHKKGLF